MSLKTRISKIESKSLNRTRAGKKREEMIIEVPVGGAEPSEEEREIAIKRGREVFPNSSTFFIWYLPYDYEELIPGVLGGKKVEWDHELGVASGGIDIYIS